MVNDVRAQDAGTYVCTAQNAQTQVDVPITLVVTGVVPHFAQAPSSYMVFPTLPDAYLNFDIEVSFKPENEDGEYVWYFVHLNKIKLLKPFFFFFDRPYFI